ncbi:unnamed protein product [Sphenostylis stenocarpa]|uniref:Transmembrane protein 70 n=1 Tax=Sphenostylis stenocarpa TaxID=92480 RepID=A0AA86VF69_9FABA|nr:unnamed protein product [Sphenostylis stenocarpa]
MYRDAGMKHAAPNRGVTLGVKRTVSPSGFFFFAVTVSALRNGKNRSPSLAAVTELPPCLQNYTFRFSFFHHLCLSQRQSTEKLLLTNKGTRLSDTFDLMELAQFNHLICYSKTHQMMQCNLMPFFHIYYCSKTMYLLFLLVYICFHGSAYQCFRSSTFGRPNSVNPSFKIPSHLGVFQRRWASPAPATEEDDKISIGPRDGGQSGEADKETGVVYYGPISNTIKKVKLLSLSTCCLSVSLGPVITFMTSPDMNVILKGAVASSVIFLSASTTAALHWFVSPYIHKLRWQPGSDSFEVDMLSWLATSIPKTIKFSDIRPPETNRPFVTFKANGNFYFVDAEHCHNKALLARLTPKKVTHDSPFKNL